MQLDTKLEDKAYLMIVLITKHHGYIVFIPLSQRFLLSDMMVVIIILWVLQQTEFLCSTPGRGGGHHTEDVVILSRHNQLVHRWEKRGFVRGRQCGGYGLPRLVP